MSLNPGLRGSSSPQPSGAPSPAPRRHPLLLRLCLGVLLAATLLSTGCSGKSSGSQPSPAELGGELLLAEKVGDPANRDDMESRFASLKLNSLDVSVGSDNQSVVKFLVDVVWSATKRTAQGDNYWVTTEKIHYTTTDAKGNEIRVSGIAFIPWNASLVKAPILCLQHGTQIYRDYAPSKFLYDMWKYIDDPKEIMLWAESIVGYMYAHAGYIVVMPDYPSMGINRDYHPYMDPSIANSVTDLHKAVQARLLQDTWKKWTVWNQQTFLVGFSEGGYATMVAARRMQEKNLTVTAVAPLDGPYDLSTTMRNLMTANAPHKAPYFLPYTLVSFQKIKGDGSYKFSDTMKTPWNETLPPMLDGSRKSEEVTNAMPVRADGQRYPPDILTASFLAQMAKPYTGNAATDGPVVTDLAANDAYRGWKPAMPMRLFHCQTDDLVPVGNSRAALKAWIDQTNVTGVQDVVPLDLADSPVHVQAALPALLDGFLWLDGYRKR